MNLIQIELWTKKKKGWTKFSDLFTIPSNLHNPWEDYENYKIISKDSVSLNYASFLIISAVNSEVVLFPPMSLVLEPLFTTS